MGRARSPANRKLPKGLRCRNGYYSYTSRVDGREVGLGRNRVIAFREAVKRNALLEAPIIPFPEFSLTAEAIVNAAVRVEALVRK